MSYKITGADIGAVSLNEQNIVRSVIQNIAIILSTRQRSAPLYRDFGLPMDFIDRPIPVARPLLVAEITEAIARYEPRAALIGVTFELDEAIPGRLMPTVEVEISEQ